MEWRGKKLAVLLFCTVLVSSLVTAVIVDDNGIFAKWKNSTFAFGSYDKKDFDSYIQKLSDTYGAIKENSIHKVDDEKLIDGAIRGMVQSLDDPYSEYMNQEETEQFYSELESSFSGIGTEVTIKNGRVTVVSPIKGTPAEKAGIRAADQIIKVDGKSLQGMSLQEAVQLIRGPKGSKVSLEIHRPQSGETMQITVVRDEIPVHTIQSKVLPDGIGYIEITQFGEKTSTDFFAALDQLEKKNINGLIIDVRGNPGGYLRAVMEISEKLLPKDKVYLQIEYSDGKKEVLKAKGDEVKQYPIVILVDKGSASASEILAASFQEAGGYQVVGETTFGKGTVQSPIDFSDGSNLKLTIAKWLTPNGTWIDQKGTKGVKPNVTVAYPEYFAAVMPSGDKVIKIDENSMQVKNVQLILEALGYNPGRKDGYFDAQTQNAVKSFQQIAGLPATGEIDKKTATELQAAFDQFIKDPKADVQLQTAIQSIKKSQK